MDYTASQFFESGITIGLSFAAFRENKYRQGIAALALWYILYNGIVHIVNWWVYVLSATYISVIALGVFYTIRIIRKPFITNVYLRIATPTVIIGVANSLIIVILNLYLFWHIRHNLYYIPESMLLNLNYGALMGLCLGIGNEILEEYIFKKVIIKEVAS